MTYRKSSLTIFFVVDTQLEALAVETRRTIYQMLLEEPRSVSEIAADLPISRPAVSQHLKVLLDAELARLTVVGNRHVYAADPRGMAALREWVDEMWDMAIGSFATFARKERERMDRAVTPGSEPVVKTVTVPGEPGWAFELFTNGIDGWWPKRTHSVAGDEAERVAVEPGVGGRIYEVARDGVEQHLEVLGHGRPADR